MGALAVQRRRCPDASSVPEPLSPRPGRDTLKEVVMSLITSPPDRVRDAQAQVPPRGDFWRRAAKERLTAGWPTGRQAGLLERLL